MKECFKKHQATSHAGAEQRFKGGLADHSAPTARLHTATHLLHAALRKVLGDEVAQKGSNITAERLRFDFSFGRKLTKEELAEVERLVNEAIDATPPDRVRGDDRAPKPRRRALSACSTSKYGESVKVYTMGPYSKEICGGPHATNTGDLKQLQDPEGRKSPLPECAASRPLSALRRKTKPPFCKGNLPSNGKTSEPSQQLSLL